MLQLLQNAWEPNRIRRTTWLQIFLVSLAFLAIVRIYPCGLVRQHTYSNQSSNSLWQESSFGESDKKLQTVIFAQEHIYRMTMYLSVEEYTKGDKVTFRLYNDSFSCIYEEDFACSRIAKDGYLCAEPDMDVMSGQAYYYEVLVAADSGTVLNVPIAENTALAQDENGILYIDGIINTEYSLVCDFDYTQPLSVVAIILYDLLILAAALVCYVLLLWTFERLESHTAQLVKYGKGLATGVTAVAAVAIFVQTVVCNIFGGESADRVVYAFGIAAGVFWLMCMVWLPRVPRKVSSLRASVQASVMWRNYLQTLCFCFLFYSLCQYVNADREYYHMTNTRWMLIFFGLAILLIRKEKELFHIPSYVWLGISLIGSVLYCRGVTDAEELYLAKMTAAVVVVWGLVVINTLIYCKKEEFLQIKKPFFAFWLLFFILMWVFRYEKTWPFIATLPFATLLLYNLDVVGRSRLLKNFINGILVSFGLVVLFSLLHRPYHFWMLYRYSMMFHTVACTGMYLSTVFAAALVKLCGKWSKQDSLVKGTHIELFLFSTVVVFIIFTMSRTAALTVVLNLLTVMGANAFLYKKNWLRIAKECGTMLCVILISFPLIFSMVRMLPALAHNVVIYDIETQDDSYTIYSTDAIDSSKYMSVERFFNLLFFRFDVFQAKGIEVLDLQESLLAYMGGEKLPIAAESEERNYVLSGDSDASNGRLTIFKDYLQNLKLVGHKTMEAEGTDYAHAHNSYIQVAHDFGIPAGIVFLLICVYTLIESVKLYLRNGKKQPVFVAVLSLTVSFEVMSLTEWAFHPCIPAGFAFLFVQMLLMQKTENNSNR